MSEKTEVAERLCNVVNAMLRNNGVDNDVVFSECRGDVVYLVDNSARMAPHLVRVTRIDDYPLAKLTELLAKSVQTHGPKQKEVG